MHYRNEMIFQFSYEKESNELQPQKLLGVLKKDRIILENVEIPFRTITEITTLEKDILIITLRTKEEYNSKLQKRFIEETLLILKIYDNDLRDLEKQLRENIAYILSWKSVLELAIQEIKK
ncbi:MAG: hypothetical protein ACFFD1_10735 [Candidatus Thorarchaeota archaeon]